MAGEKGGRERREGGKKGGREGGKEGGREGGREGEREGGREGGRKGGREGREGGREEGERERQEAVHSFIGKPFLQVSSPSTGRHLSSAASSWLGISPGEKRVQVNSQTQTITQYKHRHNGERIGELSATLCPFPLPALVLPASPLTRGMMKLVVSSRACFFTITFCGKEWREGRREGEREGGREGGREQGKDSKRDMYTIQSYRGYE